MTHDPTALNSASASPNSQDNSISRLLTFLAGIYVVIVVAWFVFAPQGLFERDGYFHARYANLLPSFGLSRSFHWTQASTWRTQFCDKEFLFHVLMMPFATNTADPISGVRYFSVIISTAIFVVLFLVLKKENARWPVLFALMPLCMGGPFLLRALMIRSHVLSISLLLIGMLLMLKRKWKLLGVLGFVYAWSYTFPFLLLMTAVPFSIGIWIKERTIEWKLPAAAFAGVTLGLIIHPYSPLTLETFLTYLQVMRIGTGTSNTALELGNEIYPMPWDYFLLHLPLYTLAFSAALIIAIHFKKCISGATLGAIFAALFWYLMSIHHERFIEYGVPLVALALGLVVRDAFRNAAGMPARGMLVLAALSCVAAHVFACADLWDLTKDRPPPRFRGAAAWMTENLEPSETVAQILWVEFPEIYYDGYRENYLYGLDPTYTLRYDPQISATLERMRAKGEIDPEWLSKTFHARFLILGHAEAMKYTIFSLTHWEPVYADAYAVVFALNGRYGPPADLATNLRAEPLKLYPSRAIRIGRE